jgi:hypothetical protein
LDFYYCLKASDFTKASCFSSFSYFAIKLSTSEVGLFFSSSSFGVSIVGGGGAAYVSSILVVSASATSLEAIETPNDDEEKKSPTSEVDNLMAKYENEEKQEAFVKSDAFKQ